jgi:hypothetical protein
MLTQQNTTLNTKAATSHPEVETSQHCLHNHCSLPWLLTTSNNSKHLLTLLPLYCGLSGTNQPA